MAEIINNPYILERLREEIDSVIGKTRLIQETDLPQLLYLQATVKESLRLHPPVSIVSMRTFQKGCNIGGFYVPEKTRLLVNGYAIMRDPNYWEDPDEFKPERFLVSSRSCQEDNVREEVLKYIPFGSGRRACPGANLAYASVGTAIGAMVQRLDWRIKGDKVKMDEAPGAITLSMAHPLKCTLVPRTLISVTSSSSIFIHCSSQSSVSVTSDDRWSLNGMSALVTGGTRGIGRAIVEELASLGAEVHTCARNENELEICLREWNRSGLRVAGSVCDVSDRNQRENLIETVSSTFDRKLNILVNNVETNIRKPMVDFTAGEFSTLLSTNFESVFHLCQLAYPLLKASEAGRVVSISSVSGFVSLKNMSVQSSTKGAINQLTRSLACEWAKDNIRINAVAPWYIKTSRLSKS